MSSLLTVNPSRITRLLAALVVAFFGVAGMTLAGSMLLPADANAASVAPICSTAGEIGVQLADGSTRCVENSCVGVLGAEGRADECASTTPKSNVSVPDAGSGASGVAPQPVAARPTAATPADALDDGTSLAVILAWAFAGIGAAALLAGGVIFLRARARARAARAGAPTASA